VKRLDELSHGFAVWRRFADHLLKHRVRLLYVVALILVAVGLDLVRPWTIQWVLDNALAPDGPREWEPMFYIWTGAIAAALIVLLRSGATYASTLLATRVGHSVTRSLRNSIFRHLGQLPPSFHARHKSGDLLVRMMGDVPILKTMLVDSSVVIISRSVLIAGTVVMSFVVDPVTSTVIVCLLPTLVLTVRFIAGRLTQAVRKQRRKEGRMADFLHEAVDAHVLLQSLGRSEETAQRFAASNRSAARAEMRAARLGAMMSASVESLLGIALGVAIGLGSWRVISGHLTAGELIVLISYIRTLMKPIRSAAKHADKIAKGSACGDRILAILDAPIEMTDPHDPIPVPSSANSLLFASASYMYHDGTIALQDVNARFMRGQLSALCGRSGAGKTTMAALGARLFDPTRGHVLFGGKDLREFSLQEYRDQQAFDLQEPILFGETIRENLLLGTPGASDEALLAACRLAAADGFLDDLPEGLDTVLEASGVGLSGGERRRLCLARTFLRDVPLVIVDEPFVGLDRIAATRVRESLQVLASDRIVIVITHETRELEHFDHVCFLEGGRVSDSGSHTDLISRNPSYARVATASKAVAS